MPTYKDSGVDIDKADRLVEFLKNKNPAIGGFGGVFPLKELIQPMSAPLLISGCDGVGTKILLARELNQYCQIGIDLVAMSVNDILTCGATPLFFLDYLAVGEIELDKNKTLLEGILEGCKEARCILLGGETAELPGMYPAGEFDLAGFAVGLVDEQYLITGASIKAGDTIFGVPSSGLHSNGFSLARKILSENNICLNDPSPDGISSLADVLLTPTRIYASLFIDLFPINVLKGLSHITGGGIAGNLVRILPENTCARIQKNSWPQAEIFSFLMHKGKVSEDEMYRVFNMGLGMIGVISSDNLPSLEDYFNNREEAFSIIGTIEESADSKPSVLMA